MDFISYIMFSLMAIAFLVFIGSYIIPMKYLKFSDTLSEQVIIKADWTMIIVSTLGMTAVVIGFFIQNKILLFGGMSIPVLLLFIRKKK